MKAFKLRQAHTTMPPGHATCVCRVAWGTVDGMFTLGEHRTKYCYQGVSCNNSFLVDTNHHFHFRVLRRLIFGSVFVSRRRRARRHFPDKTLSSRTIENEIIITLWFMHWIILGLRAYGKGSK